MESRTRHTSVKTRIVAHKQQVVRIDRETGDVEATSETFGLTGQLTDLHKGKNAGGVWSLLIDSVSISLLFISLTGLILWLSLKKRILIGIAALSLGTAALFVCLQWWERLRPPPEMPPGRPWPGSGGRV